MSEKPLLSVCLPTYNRAELLRAALYGVVRQAAALGGRVEVVVSDNASTDGTPEVVEWARRWGPVRCHRNDENVGAGRNFLRLARELAGGEYCWLLGDDDVLREGALAEVVAALEGHPEIDYAFVNYSHEQAAARRPGLIEDTSAYGEAMPACFEPGRRVVDRWERIIGLSDHGGLFTYLGSHVLRTRLWREAEFGFETDAGFPSLEATFPHACVTARHMVGRPALYLGRPLVLVFLGAQEWTRFFPMIALVRTLELADYMASLGAEAAMVGRYRNSVLRASSGCFWRLLRDPSVEGRDQLRVGEMCRRYWRCPGFYMMLAREPARTLIADPLRRLRGGAERLLRRPAAAPGGA